MTHDGNEQSRRRDWLNRIDSVILLEGFADQEPIQNLRYLLLTSVSEPQKVQAGAEFVRSLIKSLRQIPLMPELSLWQNYLANLLLSSIDLAKYLDTNSRDLDGAGTNVVSELFERDLSTLANLFLLDLDLEPIDICSRAFCPVGCSSLEPIPADNPPMASRKSLLSLIAQTLSCGTQEESIPRLQDVLEKAARLVGPGPIGMSHVLIWSPESHDSYELLTTQDCLRRLSPVMDYDPVTFDYLVGYERQKEEIIRNTHQLAVGAPANNMLLYGDRGTGKSSMVKAAALAFAGQGVRLIDVRKERFRDIPAISHALGSLALKFIVFVDDLSFEESETEYKHMKALLEGGVRHLPQNVVLYATSNRRHLVTERFTDMEDDLSGRDTAQEKLSLSDRFGITLTFVAPTQKEYLCIVQELAKKAQVCIPEAELKTMALQWAMHRNGLSGRTAKQFVRDLVGRQSM